MEFNLSWLDSNGSRSLKFSLILLVLVMSLVSCKSELDQKDPDPSNEVRDATYSDPFSYCKAIGTIDSPDTRYVGPKVPEAIVQGLKKAFGAPPDGPIDVFMRGTYWRCMDGKVYSCNVGANLPCTEKADKSRTPNEGMINFCNSNPDSEIIPAYAAGRATVYDWSCNGTKPQIVKEVTQVDAEGYISNIWYEISPN